MAGKISRVKQVKQGHRGSLGIAGKTHRARSKQRSKKPNAHVRANDYVKMGVLMERVQELEREELLGLAQCKTKAEVEGKKKLLKNLLAKQKLKQERKN